MTTLFPSSSSGDFFPQQSSTFIPPPHSILGPQHHPAVGAALNLLAQIHNPPPSQAEVTPHGLTESSGSNLAQGVVKALQPTLHTLAKGDNLLQLNTSLNHLIALQKKINNKLIDPSTSAEIQRHATLSAAAMTLVAQGIEDLNVLIAEQDQNAYLKATSLNHIARDPENLRTADLYPQALFFDALARTQETRYTKAIRGAVAPAATAVFDNVLRPTFDQIDQTVAPILRRVDGLQEQLLKESPRHLQKLKSALERLSSLAANPSGNAEQIASYARKARRSSLKLQQISNLLVREFPSEQERGRLQQWLQILPIDFANLARSPQTLNAQAIRVRQKVVDALCRRHENPIAKLGRHTVDGAMHSLQNNLSTGTWIDQFTQGLTSILNKSVSAVTKQMVSSLAGVLLNGIGAMLTKMQDDPLYETQYDRLTKIQEHVAQIKNNPSPDLLSNMKALGVRLKELKDVYNTVTVVMNGLTLPRIFEDPNKGELILNANFQDHIDSLRAAMAPVDPVSSLSDDSQKDWKALAHAEKDVLVKNMADYAFIQYIWEVGCKKPPDRNLYLRMMHNAKVSKVDLETLVLNQVKEKIITWGDRIHYCLAVVKCKVFGVYGIFHAFFNNVISAYFTEINQYFQKQQPKNFEGFINTVLDNATSYLASLNGSFNDIPSIKPEAGRIPQILKKEMERPERNNGKTLQELSEELLQNVLKKGTKGNWILTPWLMRRGLGDAQKEVSRFMEATIASLRDGDGFTPALSQVIYTVLGEVEKNLKKASSEDSSGTAPHRISDGRKRQLTELMSNLLLVLKKSKCTDIDALRKLCNQQNPTTQEKLLEFFVERILGGKPVHELVVHESAESAALVLSKAIASLADEQSLQKIWYKFVTLANDSFKIHTAAPPSFEENLETQRSIKERTDRILRHAIDQGVKAGIQSLEQAPEKANQKMESLRIKTQEWIASADRSLRELSALNLSSTEAMTKVQTIATELQAFLEEAKNAQREIEKNNWSSRNRRALQECYSDIAAKITPLKEAIEQMAKSTGTLGNYPEIRRRCQQTQEAIAAIQSALTTLTASESSLDSLAPSIMSLKENQEMLANLSHQGKATKDAFDTFSRLLLDVKDAQATKKFIQTLLTDQTSLFAQLHGAPASSAALSALYSSLQDQITLSIPQAQRQPLMQALEALVEAKSLSADAQLLAKETFTRIAQSISQDADRRLGEYAIGIRTFLSTMRGIIDRSGMLTTDYVEGQRSLLRSTIERAIEALAVFRSNYAERLQPIPYMHFNALEAATVEGYAKDAVYKLAKGNIDDFIEFVSQENLYPSLIMANAIGPFVEHQKTVSSN